MIFSIGLLIVLVYLAYDRHPRERQEDAHVHGAGQIGLLAAIALFGVDYYTSFFYATGEMMSSLHPYGLEKYGYIAVAFIALANVVFGFLYMYSLGIFNEGGGSYTASMRYLTPALSLIVAVVLIQDYIFTIVVSTLSGVDQALSLRNATGIPMDLALSNRCSAGFDQLLPDNPRARRIGAGGFYDAVHLYYPYPYDGIWIIQSQCRGSSSLTHD